MQDRPRRLDRLKERAPGLHRFLTRSDPPYPFVRDIAVGALVLLLVLSSLWLYTGRWGSSPVVVVESGSMMHCANGIGNEVGIGRACESSRYGRLGTIDPGDLILVKDVDGRGDVATFAEGGERRYRASGDVVVYRPDGDAAKVPVIHRAMFWLVVESDGRYSIPDLGLSQQTSLDIDDLGLDRDEYRLGPENGPCQDVAFAHNLRPGMAGFVTKGDNNDCFDQSSTSLQYQLVDPDWIIGEARGEIPWLGLVKLFVGEWFNVLTGRPAEPHYSNASGDSKVILWSLLALLIGGPYVYEKVKRHRSGAGAPDRRKAKGPDEPKKPV